MLIRVLGPGCARCKETENTVRAAVREAENEMNEMTVEKVTDFKEMMVLGVMSIPAVLIDDQIMCTGRVPSASEVKGWIAARCAHSGSSD